MPAHESDRPEIARFEWTLLALLVVVGFALRAAYPSRLAVEHFDEGVYASNLYFTEDEGHAYPNRHLYAPPLVPWILEWSISLFGPGVVGCFGLGILTGTLTIAAVWCVARSWFGPIAALSAATLVTFSGPHIAFSRTCLTDVPLGLWWTLSLGLLTEATHRGSRAWAVAAGVAVALAWWTKYNGWLPLAISFAGLATWLILSRSGWPVARRSLGCWAVAAATAFVLWSPVWWGLQDKGGYAAVAANHARYFHGLPGWWDAFRQQAGNLALLDGMLGVFAVMVGGVTPFAWTSAARTASRSSDEDQRHSVAGSSNGLARRFHLVLRGVLLVAFSAFVFLATHWTSSGYLLWGCLGLITGVIAVALSVPSAQSIRNVSLAVATSWYGSLLVLTPLYRPYPRLAIPLTLGSAILAGLLPQLEWLTRRRDPVTGTAGEVRPPGRAIVAFVLLPTIVLVQLIDLGRSNPRESPWVDRADLARVVSELHGTARSDATKQVRRPDCVVYVYAEPAVFFHLSAADQLAGPVSDLEFAAPGAKRMPMPTYLVVGPHARRTDQFNDRWAARRDRFEKVGEWTWRPSLIVLLDHYRPEEVRDPDKRPVETIELYRLR